MTAPEARPVHRTATRLRIRIPAKAGDHAFFGHLRTQLAQCPYVAAAEANPATASVLISHDRSAEAIIEYAQKRNLFNLQSEQRRSSGAANATVATYRTLDSRIRSISAGSLNLADTAFVTLVGTGIYQMSRGRLAAPAWHVAFWYAFNVFMKAQEIRERIAHRKQARPV